jgi:hypothetical protein
MCRFTRTLVAVLLAVSILISCKPKEDVVSSDTSAKPKASTSPSVTPSQADNEVALFETVNAQGVVLHGAGAIAKSNLALKVVPGTEAEAKAYYADVIRALTNFPKPTLPESTIADMLVYNGFPALLASDIEKLDPAVLMDFARLRGAVSNPGPFAAAYQGNPLTTGEIVAVRFFAPKIINVRDPQVAGVPVGGFGWRKVIRFRSRAGSAARNAGISVFYLLFNFTTQAPTFPPPGTHAGQIQGILQPIYPTNGTHRDLYFLVYEALDSATPEKVGFFLKATFDLAGVVPDDKYYVPRSCAQCHGSTAADQKRAKVNYLDTDHWIDRTGDDFKKVSAFDVIVDGTPAYVSFRQLNTEILTQNVAVVAGGPQFALLAARKWLDLHTLGGADAARHVPPLRRGFVQNSGDAVWTEGATPDVQLLPQLNQYCFRCHSSIAYHVFQKQAVISKKFSISGRVESGSMPQDRVLDAATKQSLLTNVDKLPE